MKSILELAEAGYNAYCEDRHWESIRGDKLPAFKDQRPELIQGWCKAAEAIQNTLTEVPVVD